MSLSWRPQGPHEHQPGQPQGWGMASPNPHPPRGGPSPSVPSKWKKCDRAPAGSG